MYLDGFLSGVSVVVGLCGIKFLIIEIQIYAFFGVHDG
jgi:hypothetical protein